MKRLSEKGLKVFLASIEKDFDLRVPVRLHDGTRGLGRLDEGPLALEGGRLPRKPTELFFPQFQPVFTASSGEAPKVSVAPERPLCAVGFTAQDLACLRFIDRFFARDFCDDLYFSRRDGALIVGVSGYCGEGETLLPVAGADCDLELIRDGEGWILTAYSEAGRRAEGRIEGKSVDAACLEDLRRRSEDILREERTLLLQATELLRQDRVPDVFWEEIGELCIACTGCNLACPTCTCFGVRDWDYGGYVERFRIWDSCQLGGFMREASGHNPLGTEGARTRRRIHHKLAADLERWGEISCFSCGRCDAVCPTGIGIRAVARKMVARFGCPE